MHGGQLDDNAAIDSIEQNLGFSEELYLSKPILQLGPLYANRSPMPGRKFIPPA